MKTQSLMKKGTQWVPLEVEISLTGGIPGVEFLGLPDTLAKESIKRIKTAFENCDLPWPRKQKITINLRPNYLRKTSQGLDLPVAIGMMKSLGVLEEGAFPQNSYFYGELDLEGGVHQPQDLKTFVPSKKDVTLVTGAKNGSDPIYCQSYQMNSLTEWKDLTPTDSGNALDLLKPPEVDQDILFSPKMAELLKILVAGEHNALFAGPAGSGKTTLAHAMHAMLRPPTEMEFRKIRKIHLQFDDEITWRPLAAPHHTIPLISMVGGSSPIVPGELSRGHGGILLLDELLEFSGAVQESLREPMESGEVRVSRRGVQARLPARFQTIATTNLCPCGKYVPGQFVTCRFSLRKCRSYLERLSGPVVDRFDVLSFSDQWVGERTISPGEITEHLNKVFQFQKEQGRAEGNSRLSISEISKDLLKEVHVAGYWGENMSLRRKRAVLRVARTFADLEFKSKIQMSHMTKAENYAIRPFVDLESLD